MSGNDKVNDKISSSGALLKPLVQTSHNASSNNSHNHGHFRRRMLATTTTLIVILVVAALTLLKNRSNSNIKHESAVGFAAAPFSESFLKSSSSSSSSKSSSSSSSKSSATSSSSSSNPSSSSSSSSERGSSASTSSSKSSSSSDDSSSYSASTNNNNKSRGVVTMELSHKSRLRSSQLPYIRCGPIYATHTKRGDESGWGEEEGGGGGESEAGVAGPEVVLLHGSSFRKETWDERTGILDKLCEADTSLSVTALDLSVAAQGHDFPLALQALQNAQLLSGEPVVAVTPSASGKAVVTLPQEEEEGPPLLRGWIPVAAGAVRGASPETLQAMEEMPILAIYGNRDRPSRYRSTERLVEEAHATSLELEGPHPCYLESPQEFADAVVQFVQQQYK